LQGSLFDLQRKMLPDS